MKVDPINELFKSDLNVINLGLESFAENLREQGTRALHVDWKPPAGGDSRLVQLLDSIERSDVDIAGANEEAVRRILAGKPTLVGIGRAADDVPGMHKKLILHAGPPVSWEHMSGPLRGAILGGVVYEGLAKDLDEAEKVAKSGDVTFEPCHHHSMAGPMAGVVTASMPVWIMENKEFGNRAYTTLNEGLGKVLRYGANGPEVIERLKWMENELAPILQKTLELRGEIDMKNIIAQVLQMGDEGHNRVRAGTSLMIRELAPHMVMLEEPRETIKRILSFMNDTDHFFLNLSMPAAKCTVDAAKGIEGSSIITTMARNGTEFGIRVSGLGDQWFTGPASVVDGLYLPGFTADDAALDIGDSVITETVGIGGFAMAAAPAIVKFVGGSAETAVNFTQQMYEITTKENDTYQIPQLDFRGTPTGIDVLKIVETGTLPAINTGIAHKDPGVGMVGAGLVKPPMKCFEDAFEAFAKKYGK
jgi:hypothetical protein